MQKLLQRRLSKAFTLIELMIVVVIVAILALVAIPLYEGNVTAAQFSEGVAGAGSIRTALRVYAASHNGEYPTSIDGNDGASLSDINVAATDLQGKYFSPADYVVNVPDATHYTITATNGAGDTYIVDEAGIESGSYTTGQ